MHFWGKELYALPQDGTSAQQNVETKYTLKAVVEDVEEVHVKEEKNIDTEHRDEDLDGDLNKENRVDVSDVPAGTGGDVIAADKRDVDLENAVDVSDVPAGTGADVIAADKRDVDLENPVDVHDVPAGTGADLDGDFNKENLAETVDRLSNVPAGSGSDVSTDGYVPVGGAATKRDVSAVDKCDVSPADKRDVDTDRDAKSDGSKSDTTTTSVEPESDTTYCTTVLSDASKDSNIKVVKEVPPSTVVFISDTTYTPADSTAASTSEGDKTDWATEEEDVRLSPDESSVKISNKQLTLVDKPTRLRSETRGQYMCRLALQFTRNQHKKITDTSANREDSILYVDFTHLSPILIIF